MQRRSPAPYPDCVQLLSMQRCSPAPYPIGSLAQLWCN
jgi:hypothetical protein